MAQHRAAAPKVGESRGPCAPQSLRMGLGQEDKASKSHCRWEKMGLKLAREGNGIRGNSRASQRGFSGLTSTKVQVMHSNPKIEAQAAPKKPCLMAQCQSKVLQGYRSGESTGQWRWLLDQGPRAASPPTPVHTEVPKLFGSLPGAKELLQGSPAAPWSEGLSRWPSTAWQSPALPGTQSQKGLPAAETNLKHRNKKGETAAPMRWEINVLSCR